MEVSLRFTDIAEVLKSSFVTHLRGFFSSEQYIHWGGILDESYNSFNSTQV